MCLNALSENIPVEYVSIGSEQAWLPNSHKLFNFINLPAGEIEQRSHPEVKPGHTQQDHRTKSFRMWISNPRKFILVID